MNSATIQQSSMPAVQGIGPLEPDMGLAQQSNPELGMIIIPIFNVQYYANKNVDIKFNNLIYTTLFWNNLHQVYSKSTE